MQREKKRVPPKELQEMIDVFNALPKEVERLQSIVSILEQEYLQERREAGEVGQEVYNDFQNKFAESLFKVVEPKLAQRLDDVRKRRRLVFDRLVDELGRIIRDRDVLYELLEKYKMWASVFDAPESYQGYRLTEPFIAISFNGDTSIKFSHAEVLEVLTKYPIPVERIRICKYCELIFWARRIDAPTCSGRCSNNFNARSTRIRKLGRTLASERAKLEKQREQWDESHPWMVRQRKRIASLEKKFGAEGSI